MYPSPASVPVVHRRPTEAEHPPHHIEHVDAHIAHDAVAVFGERSPTSRVNEFVVRSQRSGAGPHFVVEISGRSDVRRVVLRTHLVVTVNLDQANCPEQSGLDDFFHGIDEVRCTTALHADLDDFVVLAGRVEHRFAFQHVDANRLLHPNIRPRFDRGDHWQRMPMVRRRNDDDVAILLF